MHRRGYTDIRKVGKKRVPRFVDKPLPPKHEQKGCNIVERNNFDGEDNGMLCDSHNQCRGARECSCFGWCEGDDNCPEFAIPGTDRAFKQRNRKEPLAMFEEIVFNCTKEKDL